MILFAPKLRKQNTNLRVGRSGATRSPVFPSHELAFDTAQEPRRTVENKNGSLQQIEAKSTLRIRIYRRRMAQAEQSCREA
jgi:hypothetical protein